MESYIRQEKTFVQEVNGKSQLHLTFQVLCSKICFDLIRFCFVSAVSLVTFLVSLKDKKRQKNNFQIVLHFLCLIKTQFKILSRSFPCLL